MKQKFAIVIEPSEELSKEISEILATDADNCCTFFLGR